MERPSPPALCYIGLPGYPRCPPLADHPPCLMSAIPPPPPSDTVLDLSIKKRPRSDSDHDELVHGRPSPKYHSPPPRLICASSESSSTSPYHSSHSRLGDCEPVDCKAGIVDRRYGMVSPSVSESRLCAVDSKLGLVSSADYFSLAERCGREAFDRRPRYGAEYERLVDYHHSRRPARGSSSDCGSVDAGYGVGTLSLGGYPGAQRARADSGDEYCHSSGSGDEYCASSDRGDGQATGTKTYKKHLLKRYCKSTS